MISELIFDKARIRIWDHPLDAPIQHHPLRNEIKLDARKKEWDRVAQCLLPDYTHDDVIKNQWGQPNLIDGKCISISHSGTYAAIAISNSRVGIDIQVPHPSVYKIRDKFCHVRELQFLEDEPSDMRYLKIWCAKEAIFKIYGHQIDFSKDLLSAPFREDDSVVIFHQQGNYHKKEDLIVHFIQKSNYFVAIAQNLIP